jgi:4-hydroxy-tetrahydrodipicolinate synthase
MHFNGVFAVLCTPFTLDGELDLPSLRREVRFCVDCGAHGLVGPVNASEFYTLTDDERKVVVETITDELAGAIPLVAGCTAVSAHHAVMLARHAQAAGAAAIMAMPPTIRKAAGQEIFDYYRAISDAISIPIVIQDYALPLGTPMSVELMARMVDEIEHVQFLKEETPMGSHVLSELVRRCGDRVAGIMGGQGGKALFNEYSRGGCGTMPACHLTDVQVDIWEHLTNGREGEARRLFNLILPLINFEGIYQVYAYKEVLRRRGVFSTNVCRGGPAPLDSYDLRELTVILETIDPLFRVR